MEQLFHANTIARTPVLSSEKTKLWIELSGLMNAKTQPRDGASVVAAHWLTPVVKSPSAKCASSGRTLKQWMQLIAVAIRGVTG